MSENPELDLAYQFVSQTNKNIFLTGKAGTGKTTFLKKIRREIAKRMAVVAPTGVAAINAEGVTIHSLFQLPFGPIVPGAPVKEKRKFNRQKIQLIKGIELLVIDEISMVRADVLDAIDGVMKRYKNPRRPFGGAQVLMIGDLHQLPPVVNSAEWTLLQSHFSTPYFFGSNALKESKPVVIQLKKIYRQADKHFIAILNKVRQGKIDKSVLDELNTRYRPNVDEFRDKGYITLASHNAKADQINAERLKSIEDKGKTFYAQVNGNFPENSYPTEENLLLKKGAQVMFVKNDSTEEKRYFNGKIGTVSRFSSDGVYVQDEDGKEILVKEEQWDNRRYNLDEKTKEVKEEIIGSFVQVPLKLAWAITIHKSQGLTFDKLIIDAEAAFAHGQVYVALSRCKSFEGIVLSSKLRDSSIKTDEVVSYYSKESEQNHPSERELHLAKKSFQEDILIDFFGFSALQQMMDKLNRLVHVNQKSLPERTKTEAHNLISITNNEFISVGGRFCREMEAVFEADILAEESEALKQRLNKASAYFLKALDKIEISFSDLDFTSDNKELKAKLKEISEEFDLQLHQLKTGFEHLKNGFETEKFIREQANAEIDFAPGKKKKQSTPKDVENPSLYQKLVSWRRDMAKAIAKPAYIVFQTKSLIALANAVPQSNKELLEIPGVGKAKVDKYGIELLDIMDAYAANSKIYDGYLEPEKPKRKKKGDTQKESFELYQKGMTVEEIAVSRKLTEQTVHGHLAKYVGEKKIDIKDVMNAKDAQEIVKYYSVAEDDTLNKAKAHFGDRFDYYELNYAREFWKGL
jgi:tRNA uridine 5-carbamoylmethylation protein Kti12